MESITNAANVAATTVKNTIWGQSTATDTDSSGRADSHAQRSVDPTSATREVTSDTYDESTGSKFGAGSTATPMKHETGPSSGLDTSRDISRDDSFAHKSEPFRDTAPTAPILSTPSQPTGTGFDSITFDTGSRKSPMDTATSTSPFDTEALGHTKHQASDAPMSDTASTDEVRGGYGRVYPDTTSKTTDASSHHDQHKTEAAGAVGTAVLGTGLGSTHDKYDTQKTSSASSGSSPADELHSVNAPPGPTGTEVKVTNPPQTNTRIPTAGVPGMSVSEGPSNSMSPGGHISGAQPSKATDTADAAPSSVQHTMAGSGPGTAVEPSVSAAHTGITPQKQQGADRPMDEPGTGSGHTPNIGAGNVIGRTTSHEQEHHRGDSSHSSLNARRKSEPLVGAPQPGEHTGPGLPAKMQLPGDHGTGEGTGTKYERSTGLAAEGGDFDASRPGAGKEADRLLDEHNVEHGKAMGRPGQHAGDTHGHEHKFGFGHHAHHEQHPAPTPAPAAGERRGSTGKASLGEKIKEKLHIGGHGKQH